MSGPAPSEWSERYERRHTPWDLGTAHPELAARLSDGGLGPPGTAFVPGAGLGHDAAALADAGWDVVALDFAPGLEGPLGERMAEVGGRAMIGDAFDFAGGPFDLVFDHTFFCAIAPADRPRFQSLVDRVTFPSARLVSVVFPIGRVEPGPPWGVTVSMLSGCLGDGWELATDEPARNPAGRGWEARWAEWVRV